jgi:type III pantothenate kinase
MVERYWSELPVSIVGPGVKTGVKIHTDNPREVGADRVVNALAASDLYGGPAIVVDLNGTATIFDVIDADNAYIGGAIAPAPELSLDALARRGAQLRAVELAAPRSVIGKNTVEAVQSGTVYGFAGLVDGIVSRIIAELQADTDEVAVIATGAYCDVVVEHCRTITERDRWLTLHGLRLVHDRNH